MIAAHDKELAKALGTNRASLRRWRAQFPGETPPTRDVEAWRAFMRNNCLGPYSAQRGHGEGAPAGEAATATAKAAAPASHDGGQAQPQPPTGAAHWRAEHERIKFEKSAIELRRIDGSIMDGPAATMAIGEALTRFVCALDRFPYTSARFLMGASSDEHMIELLEQEIRPVRHSLADFDVGNPSALLTAAGYNVQKEPRLVEVLTNVFAQIGDEFTARHLSNRQRPEPPEERLPPMEWEPPPSYRKAEAEAPPVILPALRRGARAVVGALKKLRGRHRPAPAPAATEAVIHSTPAIALTRGGVR